MIDSVSDPLGGDKRRRRGKADRQVRPTTDRLPPHSDESEAAVVGCVLLEPSNCLDALEETGFKPKMCFDMRCEAVLTTALAMHQAIPRVPIDLVTIGEELKKRDLLDQVGGYGQLSAWHAAAYGADNLPAYVGVIKEKWQLRKLIQLSSGVVGRIYEAEGDVDELTAEIEKEFSEIAQTTMPATEWDIKRILLEKVIPDLEGHYSRGRAQIRGMTTGLEYLDKIFCGLGPPNGSYNVIAARPNVGKTSLLTQIAMHAALDYVQWVPTGEKNEKGEPVMKPVKGVPVGISSLEMGKDALVSKMLFQRGGADLQRWRTGFANEGDMGLLFKASTALGVANNIIIDDTPRLRIEQLKAKWRRWHGQYGVRLFGLDYLQLMQGSKSRFRPDRVQELAEVSAEIQALGKELGSTMLILAQMNRDYEKDPGRAPRMSDLKDCGAVEQDADTVTFLYAPRLSETQEEFFEKAMEGKFGKDWRKWDGRPERINALVGKNRYGPKGKAELLLLHSSTTFVDWIGWLKENKLRAAAKGEENRYKEEDEG